MMRRLLPLLFCFLVVAAPAGAAGRKHGSSTGQTVRSETIVFNPARTTRGIRVDLLVSQCVAHAEMSAGYLEMRGNARLEHVYTGRVDTCSVNAAGASGSLGVHWGNNLRLSLILTTTHAATVTREKLDGCVLITRTAPFTAQGTGHEALHATAFGTLTTDHWSGQLVTETDSCSSASGDSFLYTYFPTGSGRPRQPTAAQFAGGTLLDGLSASNRVLTATNIATFPSDALFLQPARDRPAGTLSDYLSFEVSGKGALLPAPGLTSASLNLTTPLSSGSLTFTSDGGCPAGVRAQEGTLNGSFTIDDPVLGPVTVTGASIGAALLSTGDADVNRCDQVAGEDLRVRDEATGGI